MVDLLSRMDLLLFKNDEAVNSLPAANKYKGLSTFFIVLPDSKNQTQHTPNSRQDTVNYSDGLTTLRFQQDLFLPCIALPLCGCHLHSF